MSDSFAAGRAPVMVRAWRAGSRSVFTLAMLAAVGSLPAQQPAQQPTQQPAPQAAAQPAAQPAPEAVKLQYGRVLAEGSKLRCWPSAVAAPPTFEDTLAKDQVVAVGRVESGFILVTLPLGPLGYVSKKFTAVADDGKVRTKGSKVAFRYKPRTTEAPVTQLADGTELSVVGEQDDWWQVRLQSVESWLPQAEVAIPDQGDATLATGYTESKTKYEGEVQARLDQIAQAKQRVEQDKADEAAVQVVQEAFTAELKKPIDEQQFTPLEEALDKVEATLAKESGARSSITTLRKRLQSQKWIVEASLVRDAKPVPGPDPGINAQPKDELEKFQSIGWLRYESRLGSVGQYYLEKGGQRQHYVSCHSGRYDLALFVGREVGVIGPRRRPITESLSVLDLERLEVLGGRAP